MTWKSSGNCYKIRLLCSLLGVSHESVAVDLMKGEHKQAAFLALNPRGQVPVLDDAGTVVWDSIAILVYLARKYESERWLPTEAETMARVMQWLALSESEILYGLARARGGQIQSPLESGAMSGTGTERIGRHGESSRKKIDGSPPTTQP